MAHLLALVSNHQKVKRSNTYVNKLVSEILWLVVIFIYSHNFTISCDDLMTKLWRLSDDFMIILGFFFRKSGPSDLRVQFHQRLSVSSTSCMACYETKSLAPSVPRRASSNYRVCCDDGLRTVHCATLLCACIMRRLAAVQRMHAANKWRRTIDKRRAADGC